MAQTITVRAHGMVEFSEARFNFPFSLRASKYFMSPACPAAIHCGNRASSGKSRTGAMPANSKPASRADSFTSAESSFVDFKPCGPSVSHYFSRRQASHGPRKAEGGNWGWELTDQNCPQGFKTFADLGCVLICGGQSGFFLGPFS